MLVEEEEVGVVLVAEEEVDISLRSSETQTSKLIVLLFWRCFSRLLSGTPPVVGVPLLAGVAPSMTSANPGGVGEATPGTR
jgi:hypothetical protein